MQFLHHSPLQDCLEPFAATLYSLFQKMAKDTLVRMSIVEFEKVANFCSMEINLSLDQDIELYKSMALNLIVDQGIVDQMKVLFELKIMNANQCIKCNYMICKEELGSLINLHKLLS